jgi:hypothetical protein
VRRIGAARLPAQQQSGLLYEIFTNRLAKIYGCGCQMIFSASS